MGLLAFRVIKQKFTFVSDCVAVILAVVGASTLIMWVGWNETWSKCVVHMLIPVIRKVLKKFKKPDSDHWLKMFNDWRWLKKVAGYVKRTKPNAQMAHGLAWIEKVENRFGKVCAVVKKFIKSSGHASRHLDASTVRDFDANTTQKDDFHGFRFRYLDAIVSSFKPFRYVRTQLGSTYIFTFHLIIPLLANPKHRMKGVSSGIMTLDSAATKATS